jgi:hypothetical protein
MPFSVNLYENPIIDTDRYLMDLTHNMGRSWRHGINQRGGCISADGEYRHTSLVDKERFFMTNLGRRIVVSAGGIKYWDGQIVRMELNKAGQSFVRTIENMANRTKVIYRKLGPQLLANGDVESGAWSAVGTPSTITTTTDWFARGTTAMHCIVDTAAELLNNNGFETAGGGGADVFANWTEDAGDGTIVDETVDFYAGAHAVELTAGPNANTQVYQNVTVTAGTRMSLSFYTRGDGTYEGQYAVYDNTNAADIIAKKDAGNASTTYVNKLEDFIVPVGCVSLGVYLYCPSTDTGVSYFDEVYLTENEGMEIEGSITIAALQAYTASVVINVVQGSWTLRVMEENTNTVIAQRSTSGTGREWLSCQVPASNTVTTIDVQLTASAPSDECYADGAILRTSSIRSETKWHEDTDSQDVYGQIEAIFLEGEMSDDEADGLAQRQLANLAWPATQGPGRGGSFTPGGQESTLFISCLGWVWSLGWRYALTAGTDQADNQVTALLDESELIASADAIIDTNTAEVLLDAGNPVSIWRAIEKTLDTGDGAGAEWVGGVYPDFEFRFEARSTDRRYEFQNGELRYYGGGRVHPVEAQPGYIFLSDMPHEPTPAGAAVTDDPRWQLASEMWLVSDDDGERNEWVFESD